MPDRQFSAADRLLINFDEALRTLHGRPRVTERKRPDSKQDDVELSDAERDHVARLMRINHTGEVCAQALYQGQALTARLPEVRESMERAAAEENDHLDWCEQRIDELGGRKSLLNPFWFVSSYAIGATAGLIGDKWSLGFVAETERQVEAHLNDHLSQLPKEDTKSRAILEQMKEDEIKHGIMAREGGGVKLPMPVRMLMKLTSKVMTKSVYRI